MADKSPAEWLEDARSTVEARGKTHGHYQDMAEMLARRWDCYLMGREVTPRRAMAMMMILKEVRDDLSPDSDHKRDLLGYAAIYAALQDKQT